MKKFGTPTFLIGTALVLLGIYLSYTGDVTKWWYDLYDEMFGAGILVMAVGLWATIKNR